MMQPPPFLQPPPFPPATTPSGPMYRRFSNPLAKVLSLSSLIFSMEFHIVIILSLTQLNPRVFNFISLACYHSPMLQFTITQMQILLDHCTFIFIFWINQWCCGCSFVFSLLSATWICVFYELGNASRGVYVYIVWFADCIDACIHTYCGVWLVVVYFFWCWIARSSRGRAHSRQ